MTSDVLFILLGAAVASAVWLPFYRHRFDESLALAISLGRWQKRHATIMEEANRAWNATEELMVSRLGYTHQAASDAIHVWRLNGYGKARLGGAEIDLVCPAEEINLPDGCLEEVLALGVIEHLSFAGVGSTFLNVHRMLRPRGEFILDAPDLEAWCSYLLMSRYSAPFDHDHILHTLYGWQRWPGDEHRSGWTERSLLLALDWAGFHSTVVGVDHLRRRGLHRPRFDRPEDAHIYVVATR